ncbi:MAG: sensor histidine kinase [Tissierellia bacterium]|nr:sensor histidine kinase [Tissierellia bacterium]
MDNWAYLIARYFINLTIIIGVAITQIDSVDIPLIILTLIFVINTQFRYFQIRDRFVPNFISILVDFLLGYFTYTNYGGIILPYFLIGIIDSFFLLKGASKYILVSLGTGIFLYAGLDLAFEVLFSYIVAIIFLAFISSIIVREQKSKLKVEDLYNELRKSEDELIKANEELKAYADSIKELYVLKERNRISREIHDSVGHSLSTIIIQLGAIEKIAKENGQAASQMAANLRDFTRKGLEEIRKALKELKPKEFKEYETILSLENLIKDFSKLTGIDVKLTFTKSKWNLDEKSSLVLYRAVQEFLSNSAKHGKATKINIYIHYDDELIVTLKDNGIGTDEIKPGMGLTSLAERIKEIGGSLSYESKRNNGFFMRIVLKSGGLYE